MHAYDTTKRSRPAMGFKPLRVYPKNRCVLCGLTPMTPAERAAGVCPDCKAWLAAPAAAQVEGGR